jgi:hypothetical protein
MKKVKFTYILLYITRINKCVLLHSSERRSHYDIENIHVMLVQYSNT